MEYIDKELSHIINITINAFSEAFRDDDNVISLFAIGSMASTNYIPKQNNDFDLRLLISNPTPAFFHKLNKLADNIVATYQHETKYALSWDGIIGPVRHIASQRPTLLLHIVVLTADTLASLPTMHRRSYASKYIIFDGIDVLAEYKDIPLSATAILDDVEGIRYCRRCLTDGIFQFQKWQVANDECQLTTFREPFSIEGSYEFFRYSVSKSLDNANSLFLQKNKSACIRSVRDIATVANPVLSVPFDEFNKVTDYYITFAQDILLKLEEIIQQMIDTGE